MRPNFLNTHQTKPLAVLEDIVEVEETKSNSRIY